MKIHSYSLMRDVVAAQQRPQIPASLWHAAPLLVMNNFRGSKPLQLATALLQHLFPSIDVNTVKLASCQVCNVGGGWGVCSGGGGVQGKRRLGAYKVPRV